MAEMRPIRRRTLSQAVVVEAAAALADDAGLERLTLSALATRLNVRTPSLYNHVAGLDGLRRELALLGYHELSRRLGQAAIAKTTDAAVMAIAIAYREFVRDRPGLYTATIPSPRRDDSDPAVSQAAAETLDVVITVLGSYGLQGAEAIHAARGLRAAIHGFATLEASGGFGLPVATDESFQWLIATLIDALHRHNERSPEGDDRQPGARLQ